jgi:hypothetical protein
MRTLISSEEPLNTLWTTVSAMAMALWYANRVSLALSNLPNMILHTRSKPPLVTF